MVLNCCHYQLLQLCVPILSILGCGGNVRTKVKLNSSSLHLRNEHFHILIAAVTVLLKIRLLSGPRDSKFVPVIFFK